MTWKALVVSLLLVMRVGEASSQNAHDFINLFGGIVQQAMIQAAQSEWRKVPLNEMGCIEQALAQQRTNVQALIQRGVMPSNPQLVQLRANCRGKIAPQAPQASAPQTSPSNASAFKPPAVQPLAKLDVPRIEPERIAPVITASRESGFQDFERLLTVPSSCLAARNAGPTQMYVRDPFTGRSSTAPVCALVNECINTLPAQLTALVRYLREHPLLLGELRKQTLQSTDYQTNVDTILEGLNSGAKFAGWPLIDCNFTYGMVNNNLYPLDNSAQRFRSGFEPFVILAHSFLTKLRSTYAADIAKYSNWFPYAQHYDRADEIARVKIKYETAYNTSDIESFLLLEPDFLRQLSEADNFRAALVRQTGELNALDDQLSDLSRRAAPLSKILEPGTPDVITQLKSAIIRLRDIAPADRGDASAAIIKFTSGKRDIESKINVARATLVRQTGELNALADQLSDLSRHAAQEPLPELLEPGTPDVIAQLKSAIIRLRDVSPADRGDASTEIIRFTNGKRDIESKIKAAQTKIDDFNALEVKRQAAVNASTEALAAASGPSLRQRLSPDGLAIVRRLEILRTQLTNLAGIPLFDRPDYSDALLSVETACAQIDDIQRTAKATNDFAETVRVLNSKIDARGRRFLDSDAASAVRTLSGEANIMSRKMLPLSDADQRQLSDDMKGLGSFELKLSQLMDAQEKKYLIAQFPVSGASWNFHFTIDKLTDAQSVNAMTIVDGAEARYQIEISCKANERALSITTFEKKGDEGKPIPWTVQFSGIALKPVRQIRLRTDSDPARDVSLEHNGYSNAGTVVAGFDSEFRLVNSDRFTFGDVFPGDQVAVTTSFPVQFKRLCVMMGLP